MFDRYLKQTELDWRRRALALASILVHGLVAIMLVIWSFFHVDEIAPPALALSVFTAPPPPPAPAAPPPGRPKLLKLLGSERKAQLTHAALFPSEVPTPSARTSETSEAPESAESSEAAEEASGPRASMAESTGGLTVAWSAAQRAAFPAASPAATLAACRAAFPAAAAMVPRPRPPPAGAWPGSSWRRYA